MSDGLELSFYNVIVLNNLSLNSGKNFLVVMVFKSLNISVLSQPSSPCSMVNIVSGNDSFLSNLIFLLYLLLQIHLLIVIHLFVGETWKHTVDSEVFRLKLKCFRSTGSVSLGFFLGIPFVVEIYMMMSMNGVQKFLYISFGEKRRRSYGPFICNPWRFAKELRLV